MSDPRGIEGLESGDERQQEEAALAESLRIADYAEAMIQRDKLAGWPSPGSTPRYERHFIRTGDDGQPIYEHVRIV